MRNKLLSVFCSSDEVIFDELDETVSVRVLLVVEVEAFSCLLDADRFLVGFVLQNKLL